MAYERAKTDKVQGDSLDSFVTNLATQVAAQMKIRNADDEAEFNRAVLEDGLTLQDQLDYRKDQLSRISDDPAERKRVRAEISSLKQRVEQHNFSDDYLGKLSDFNSGISSIDTVIDFLTQQKSVITDPATLDKINSELAANKQKKFSLTQDLLKAQTDFAVKDTSVSVIQDQIGRVTSARSKALLAGDTNTVAMLDLQIQGLNKAQSENSITKDVQNFAVSSITGYATATKLLDAYNAKISSAATDAPVTVGGITYSSAKEFWSYKRDSYVADTGDAGFFGRLSNEGKQKIALAQSKSMLDNSTISSVVGDINQLVGRAELAGYEGRLDYAKQTVVSNAGEYMSDSILGRYAIDYDLTKAVGELNNLKLAGVNTDAAYSKLLTTAATIKKGAVDNILQAAQNALAANPALTPEQALNQAIATGAGTVASPQELATKGEKTITADAAKTAVGETGKEDPRLTVQPGATGAQPQTTPAATPTTPAATPSSTKTVTVKAGETLSQIAQRELGSASRYTEIAAANGISDPNKVQAGAVLKIPGAPATPAPQPTPAVQSQPTQPTPQQPATPAAQPAPQPAAQPAPTPAPQPTPTPSPTYQGASIVDYLKATNQDSTYESRAKLAKSKGIVDYSGSSAQNDQLLKSLRGF